MGGDGGRVLIGRAELIQSSLLMRDMLDDMTDAQGAPTTNGFEIPLDVIDSATLERCAVHMRYRFNNRMQEIPRPLKASLDDLLDSRDKEYTNEWDEATTVSMVRAATFLNCPELQQLACAKLASFMMSKSVEEIRVMLGVQNDFSPEEEAALRKEHGLEI